MNKPIGVFDSGLGGLTVVAEIMRLLPNEDIVYFGDTARVPYGSKSKEVVTGFSLEIASFLRKQDVKMIVVACNTASAYALRTLRRKFDIPVIGVIEPGAKTALEYTYSGRIGVIGTQGTIRSSSYTTSIKKLDPNARVFAQACPLFVPLVEEGWIDHKVTAEVAKEYLKPLIRNKVDTIVLGCTHYPLIKKVLKKLTGPGIKLVDSAEATAREVLFTLNRLGMLNAPKRRASYQFYVSDIPQKFQEIGQRCLGRPVSPVRRIDLEKKK